jgi:hypothetical protein
MRYWWIVLLAACAKHDEPPAACATTLESWPEANAIFQRDPSWLGADGAYSVDLGGDRVLWLFGDTFAAKAPGGARSDAYFLRNSIGIQTGRDPSSATIVFSYRGSSSFFPEAGAHWFWPAAGVRLPSRLVIFLSEVESATGGLGFQGVGSKVVFVPNVDDPPAQWTLQDGALPKPPVSMTFGAAIVADGSCVYAYATKEPGDHSMYVARFDRAALDASDASAPAFYAHGAWTAGATPDVIFPNGATELSVDKRPDGTWRAVYSDGFGATSIVTRTAPAPEGPWSAPCTAYTPPESLRSNVLVYAGKAHPELMGGSLIVTYAANSQAVTTDTSLYFPRFARAR